MILSELVCVIGLFIYLLVYAPKESRFPELYPRLVEIGRTLFWVGLLVYLFHRDHALNWFGN